MKLRQSLLIKYMGTGFKYGFDLLPSHLLAMLSWVKKLTSLTLRHHTSKISTTQSNTSISILACL